MPRNPNDNWIRLIAVFKLLKAAVLITTGIGVLRLLHKDVADTIIRWTNIFRVDPDNRYVHALLVKSFGLNDRKLKEIGIGTFFYAGLFLTEGLGLLSQKPWAQYFTIIVTASLLPLEGFELVRHPSIGKTIVIIANAAIVVYLVVRLRQEGSEKA